MKVKSLTVYDTRTSQVVSLEEAGGAFRDYLTSVLQAIAESKIQSEGAVAGSRRGTSFGADRDDT
ncbi:hypothetical protein LLE49_06865 [Alicyclobacillus tolerans]|uniref:hypothetical protein n=1 Tax=Alicyclobacillus tolerans TaxID=90970 RepID=UPI001F3BE2C1|nr:hypothetical protein [Alicyclobacillus tolerans]MCF8564467.1 hypothetical protein [Alicyclobacillus tolerans]